MEWVVKLEARSGWCEVERIEVATINRQLVGLTAEEIGLTLAEGKDLLGELGRLVLQTQMEDLANNTDSLIDYGERYRSKLPISTSRAAGCVDEIANARMAKKQRMRWSPQGAHRTFQRCRPFGKGLSRHDRGFQRVRLDV
jgi:hypothetical protein